MKIRSRGLWDIKALDLLAGYGGLTTAAILWGIRVMFALNHNQHCVDVHAENHLETNHVCGDLWGLHPQWYPRCNILLASPTCTYFTQARPENVLTLTHESQMHLLKEDQKKYEELVAKHQGRHTMYGVLDFVEYHKYEYVFLENVVEVHKWSLFEDWCQKFMKMGYNLQFVYWNAQFFHDLNGCGPAPTAGQSRDRWFCIANRRDMPAPNVDFRPLAPCPNCGDVRAVQVWKRADRMWGKYGIKHGSYYYGCPNCTEMHKYKGRRPLPLHPYYYAGVNHIDWTIPMQRVDDPDRPNGPVVESTRKRIKVGLEKYGHTPIIFKNSRNLNRLRFKSALLDPLYSITGSREQMLIAPAQWMDLAHGGRTKLGDNPAFTQTTKGTQGIIVPWQWVNLQNGQDGGNSDDALKAVQTRVKQGVLVSPWLVELYDGAGTARSGDSPMNTMTSGGVSTGLAMPGFTVINRSTERSRANSIEDPLPAAGGGGRVGGWVFPGFMTINYGGRFAKGIEQALSTAKGTGYANSLVWMTYNGNPTYGNAASTVATITTNERQAVAITDADVDACLYRTLRPKHWHQPNPKQPGWIYSEIGGAQGFPQGPDGYKIDPKYSTDDITRGYGNAVPPAMAYYGLGCILAAMGAIEEFPGY